MTKWYDSITFLVVCLPIIAAAVFEPSALVIVFCTYGAGGFAYCGLDCVKEIHKNGSQR